jgi:hypothetical protein
MTDVTAAAAKPKRTYNRRRKYSSERLAKMPALADLGPALRALTDQQRRFVLELHQGPIGYGSIVRAARAAGCGTPTSSDASMKNLANQILYHPKVQEALHELGPKAIRAAAFQSIKNIERIANNPKHPDHFKANVTLLNHGFPAETHHTVKVDRPPDVTVVVTEQVLERIRQLATRAGLDPAKQIELVATEVKDDEQPTA